MILARLETFVGLEDAEARNWIPQAPFLGDAISVHSRPSCPGRPVLSDPARHSLPPEPISTSPCGRTALPRFELSHPRSSLLLPMNEITGPMDQRSEPLSHRTTKPKRETLELRKHKSAPVHRFARWCLCLPSRIRFTKTMLTSAVAILRDPRELPRWKTGGFPCLLELVRRIAF